MTAEQKYFLNVISDYINGVPSAMPDEEIDLLQLSKIARYHSLAGIIYAQCKDYFSKENEAVKLLENAFTSSVFYYVCNNEALAELRVVYAAADINLLAFKGLNIAKYHPVPELRTMGDVDVLIHACDREKSHELMLSLGYKCEKPVGDVGDDCRWCEQYGVRRRLYRFLEDGNRWRGMGFGHRYVDWMVCSFILFL